MALLAPLRSNQQRRPVVQSAAMSAPVEGWDASSALAAMKPLRAVELLNWFPQPGYVEVRKGYRYHAWDLGSDTTPVETLMVWQGVSSSKMFAAAGGDIYDVTSSAQATSAVSGLSEDRWQWVNHTTSAGNFLVICNGADSIRNYNGSSWSTPSITNVASDDIIHVNTHKKRLWMIENASTKAWYLATEAIAGAATSFELGSLWSRGGYTNAMATWTRDGGSGSDDYAVFISSRGQLAVYQGTDPSSANTWSLVGVFDCPAPIGRRCFVKFGGDVLLITVEGVFALSQLLGVDQSQATRVSITDRISNAMNQAARSYASNWGWELCVYPRGTRLILNIPTSENNTAKQYVMNTLTGAWCEFDNHNAQSWVIFNDNLYFGGADGTVYRADTGSADVDTQILAVGQTAYQDFRSPGRLKRFTMLQALITTSGTSRPALGVSTDFVETSEISSPIGANDSSSIWDTARWDNATWAGEDANVNEWSAVAALGKWASVKFQARTGASSGGSVWGASEWSTALWGSEGTSDQTMRINGFVALIEPGDYL